MNEITASVMTVLAICVLAASSPVAAAEVDDLRRELEAQRERSAEQSETIRQQQEQLDSQQRELERLDRRLDQVAGEDGEPASAPPVPDSSAGAEETEKEEKEEGRPAITRDEVGDLNSESVKVGDFPGSFRIPGPRGVSLAIGGFIKVVALYDSDAENMGADFLPATLGTRRTDDDGAFSIDATLTRLHLDGRVPTDWGRLRGYVEWDLNDGNDGSLGVKWRHAYGTWSTSYGTLLVGQTWSTLMDLKILPEGLTEPTGSGLIFQRQPMIRWTQPIGQSFVVHLAAEDPSSNDVFADQPDPDLLNTKYPDGVLGLEYARPGAGHLRLNGIVRYLEARRPQGGDTSEVAWGLALTGHLDLFERDRAMFSAIYGEGLGRYLLGILPTSGGRLSASDGQLDLRVNWGGLVAYEHHWTGSLRSTAMAGYAHANRKSSDSGFLFESSIYASGNLMWSPLPYLTMGIEYGYGRRETQNGSDLDNHRVGVGFQVF